ncbi:copper amine oxidase [Paenibacillus yonginensis]|uniref:Copper amine oxidase n=1 Tax=Paenibacillus yonginensis TaxID=1462996 RepID=A0A1B1N6I4_9BACL|nr:copper amine oxidase [Paenibacillus yonginensis]
MTASTLLPGVSPVHTASAASAASAALSIQIDGTAVQSDVKPVVSHNRTLVPLRVISENLGAKVDWSNSQVTFTKGDLKVTLKPGSTSAVKNGKTVQLDVKPYIQKNRVMVPLRFLAETFGCKVGYSSGGSSAITISTTPLVIGQTPVKALQYEYHMTMGGVISQISGNAYSQSVYDLFEQNKGAKVNAPASYSWMANIDLPGSYYKNAQYDFLDKQGNSIKRYDVYSLVNAFPAEELAGFEKTLLYDAMEDQWYIFSPSAAEAINEQINTASRNGFLKEISNTVA